MAQYAYVVARNTRAGIQLEIDKAHAEGGGLVFLPRGVYRLDGPLRLKPNIHLTGVGERTVLTVDPEVVDAVDINLIELDSGDEAMPHDIEISKLALRGPGVSPDITQEVASAIGKGCGIVSWQTAVRNVVVRACRIENASGCGILFYTQSNDQPMAGITIKDCHLLQNRRPDESGTPSSYKDIFFYGLSFETVRVEDNVCVFTPNASSRYGNDSGLAFVYHNRSDGGYVRHTRLTGNICAGHRRHGLITSYGKMEDDGVFVSGNRCENNGWVGVYVNTNVNYTRDGRLVIAGNYCCNNGFGGSGQPDRGDATIRGGIVLGAAYNAVVTGNICMHNGEPGPDFARHGAVADDAAVHAAGIRVRGVETIIEGNLLKGNKNAGIAMWPGKVSHISITNNRAVQNGQHGIVMAGASGEDAQQIVVTGNVCADNGQDGIRGFYTDGALVASNYIFDNEKADFNMAGSARRIRMEGNFTDTDETPLDVIEELKPSEAKRLKTW